MGLKPNAKFLIKSQAMNKYLTLSLIFILLSASLFAQLSIEDHLAMENLVQARIYQTKIVYVKKSKARWDAPNESYLEICDINGKNIKRLTRGGFDYNPQWSPEGKQIAFISYRDNLQQIFTVSPEGGSIQMASDAQNNITGFAWYNEHSLAYLDNESPDPDLMTKSQENGGAYWAESDFSTNALWLYDTRTKEKKKITSGKYQINAFDFSPDGKYLALVGAKNSDKYEALANSWVKVIDWSNQREIYTLETAEAIQDVHFSPSGKYLAFTGSTQGYAANDGLFLVDFPNGRTQNLTYDFDPTIEKIQWTDDGHIAFLSPRGAKSGLFKTNLKGKITTILEPHWVIYDFQTQGELVFFTASSGNKTNQLYQLNYGQKPEEARAISRLNPEIQAKIKTQTKTIQYKSYDGTPVEAILTFPPNYSEARRYPLMTIPHGGPDDLEKAEFNWMGQFFADQGFIVFRPNFRGSTGYGRAFYAGNRNAFGKTDFEDIMAGIDYLIEKKLVNPDQLVIGGISYGGYMANWAITQTDRFKAAISIGGICNLVSLYGQHLFSNRELGLWEYKALPTDQIENYRRASPLFYVKQVKTPLLILHGNNDAISPTLQAWEMYRAMKDAGKEVKMMLYPRAGHNIAKPHQFKSKVRQWLQWAKQHIGKE